MAKRDYYEVLGISKTADANAIKSAYRKKAKQYHPDLNKDANAEGKFKEVQEAYEVLSDPQKKQTYDQFGHAAFDGQTGGFGGGGFNFGGFQDIDLGDLFGSFFGGGRSNSSSSKNARRKGADLLMNVSVTFMEAIKGKTVVIPLNITKECKHCNGTGAETPSDIDTCSTCRGNGSIKVEQRTILGVIVSESTCPDCKGKGKRIKRSCSKCSGRGTETIKENKEIIIPAGIDSGQRLRVVGYGQVGENGGPNGDLFVQINVSPHESFRREGQNIFLNISISAVDATLGCRIVVPTVNGEEEIDISAGTQPETTIRLKGKGVKSVNGNNYGDQFVIIKVAIPTKLSRDEKELYVSLQNLDRSENDSFFNKIKKKVKK